MPASPVDVLRRLDALRAEAFARNRPDVLRRVYASAGLLAQDRALLARLAPRGCGVVGALTTFADPVPESAAPGRVALTVTARLEASAVVCDAGRTTPLPGTRAVRLRVVLVQGPDGYRIGSQRVVTTS